MKIENNFAYNQEEYIEINNNHIKNISSTSVQDNEFTPDNEYIVLNDESKRKIMENNEFIAPYKIKEFYNDSEFCDYLFTKQLMMQREEKRIAFEEEYSNSEESSSIIL